MRNLRKGQAGKSKLGSFVFFALLAYVIFIGFQFVPQKLEEATVQSILTEVEKQHLAYRVTTRDEAWKNINRHLMINEMRDMQDIFEVSKPDQYVIIDVYYQRELNLLFTSFNRTYRQTLELGEVETLAY